MEEQLRILEFVRVGGLIPALFVLVVTFLGAGFVVRFFEGLGRRFTKRRLLFFQTSTILRLLIFFAGTALALALAFQLTSEMLLAVGGTVAVALGFALKDVVASVAAGLMIILDRPFQVGDRITFEGIYGEVVSIGLRSVRLVTLDDNLVTIPNNRFLMEAVASGNAGALDMLVQTDFHIGIDQDVDVAREIVRDALTSSRYTFAGKPWQIVINEVVSEHHFALRLRAKAYVLDVKYEKDFQTDVTVRVHRAFREHGIAPPAILEREISVEAYHRVG